jgi:membrane protease YdiL (CAAX protease family)
MRGRKEIRSTLSFMGPQPGEDTIRVSTLLAGLITSSGAQPGWPVEGSVDASESESVLHQGTNLIRLPPLRWARRFSTAEYEWAESRAVLVQRSHLVPVVTYFSIVVIAESVAAFGREPNGFMVAMAIHVVLLFALISHSALLATSDERLSRFLAVLSLAPLIRILSLGLPFTPFTIVQWLFIISLPLVAGGFTMMQVMGLTLRDVYIRLMDMRQIFLQTAVVASGFGLGAVEYFILVPEEAWIDSLTLQQFLPAVAAITLASGLAEELIFRGLLLPRSEEIFGRMSGLLFVSLLFAAMHIGFKSVADLIFVFVVGFYFGYVVQRTRNLIGVILAHGFANVVLYLLLPFYL